MRIFEACVETPDEAIAAERGGASRIELCRNLAEQGTTPDDTTVAACVAAVTIPVFVMVRPRAGHFVYSRDEAALMQRQAVRARSLGASGIVTGALTTEGAIDSNVLAAIADAVGPLPLTFHRAFDAAANRDAALEALVSIGVARVLTSGGAATALAGADSIARLVRDAAGRLVVMAGGGIRAQNVHEVVTRTGVTEVHAHLTTSTAVRELVANLDARPAGWR